MEKDILIIGRGKDCGYRIDHDKYVSGEHLFVQYLGNGNFIITDKKSSNGTFVNGELIPKNEPIQVTANASIILGPDYELNLKKIFKLTEDGQERKHPKDYRPDFANMRPLFEQYSDQKISLSRKIKINDAAISSSIILVPGLFSYVILPAIMGKDIANNIPLLTTLFSSVGAAIRPMMVNRDGIQQLEKNWKKKLVCPHCGLPFISMEIEAIDMIGTYNCKNTKCSVLLIGEDSDLK